MTVPLQISVFEILTWLKEHQSLGPVSLDELAAHFGVDRDRMQKSMQGLQRHDCAKRGGRMNAEWSITDFGLVRLAEGRFSLQGTFRSVYEYDQPGRSSGSTRVQAPEATVITVPMVPEGSLSDSADAVLPSSSIAESSSGGPRGKRDAPVLTAGEIQALVEEWQRPAIRPSGL
jgi:hypothetical protein